VESLNECYEDGLLPDAVIEELWKGKFKNKKLTGQF
jgi:hypothetical protein